jgi:hypothetical protein
MQAQESNDTWSGHKLTAITGHTSEQAPHNMHSEDAYISVTIFYPLNLIAKESYLMYCIVLLILLYYR